jgi:signal transduction histidine kinase
VRELLASAPAPMALTRGPDHVFELATASLVRLWGGRDPTGLPLRGAYPELAEQGLAALLDRVIRTGEPVEAPELELRIARAAGYEESSAFHLFLAPRRGPGGETTGVVAFALDVTAAARARHRAERAEHLLSAVFEIDPSGIAVVVGPEMRFALMNPAYRAMTPHPERDPTGRTIDEVFPIAEGFGGRAMWEEALRGAPPFVHRVERSYADGARRSFRIHAHRLRWADADAVLFVAWETTDLDAYRLRAEEGERRALRRAAELDAVVESLPSAITIHDASGVLVRMNANAERLWGAVPEDVRRLPSHVRLTRLGVRHLDGRPIAPGEAPVERALAGEVVRELEVILSGPGEPARRLALHAAPIVLPDGRPGGAVAVTEDVTSLREIDEQREDLLRTLTHDLRTPLTVVVTQAELIRRREDSDRAEIERRADAILKSARRIGSMATELVEMTQLEAGLVRLNRVEIDFAAFAGDLRERLRGSLPVDRLEVRAEPGSLVRADADRLERIVVNLVTNALKYAAEGPVTLSGDRQGAAFVIAVSDGGPGIPSGEIPRLFQRFYRTASAAGREGTGLGLYVARLLAEAHGGSISVESDVGKGSTFRVVLPDAIP